MISVNDKWGRLREIVLGKSYASEFYENVKNTNIKSCLQRIADETEEDYLHFETLLRSHGVLVHRPELDPNDRIENYVDHAGRIECSIKNQDDTVVNTAQSPDTYVSATLIPRPPMTPRDNWTVIDGDLIMTSPDLKCSQELLMALASKNNSQILDSFQTFGVGFPGGNLFPVGEDIFLGSDNLTPESMQSLRLRYPKFRWHFVDILGHTDAVYHPVKPGVIISLCDLKQYQNEFPGWDILYLPNQSWHRVQAFCDLKTQNQGKWWLPGEENNSAFTSFVESWLHNWVGFVEETVFDVNCLVLDPQTVFVNNYNKQVFEFLKKHRMEPVIVPFRHRYFWDGGLHCITLELYREGDLVRYL